MLALRDEGYVFFGRAENGETMSDDNRLWVLDHERSDNSIRFWHWYRDGHYQPAVCGKEPIPGMPIVAERPCATVSGPSQVCGRCAGVELALYPGVSNAH
jgi:hypothetical protein